LAYRDFRLLWFGALISSIGTWMQKIAQAWLIVTLTSTASAFYLGLDAFLGEAPILLFTLIGGVVADRANRRHLMLASQFVQMTAAFTLAALVFTDHIQIWHILALSFITGIAQAFGGPAYQSLIPSLIPKETLPNAIALNSIQFNLARVIGPAIAGVALAAFGMVACFGLNGISFLFVMAAIVALRVTHVPPSGAARLGEQLRGGLHYVRDHPPLMTLTVLGFVSAFLGLPLLTFLPIITKDVFAEGVGLYSQFMTIAGIGAVLGAVGVAWIGKHRHMGMMLLIMQALLGLVAIGFSLSQTIWLSQLLLFLGGALLVTCFSMVTSLVQLLAPQELRGRVVSIYMVAFRGGSPLGGLISGWLVTQVGSAPIVLALNGGLLTVVALLAMTRDHGLREL
jgi:MFS family permease